MQEEELRQFQQDLARMVECQEVLLATVSEQLSTLSSSLIPLLLRVLLSLHLFLLPSSPLLPCLSVAITPGTLQGQNDVLQDFSNQLVFVYLDNILIFSQDLIMHQKHFHQVLQLLL